MGQDPWRDVARRLSSIVVYFQGKQKKRNTPEGRTVEFDLGQSWVPVFVQDGPDVKHGQHASDDEVNRPESQVLAGTNPSG